MLYVVFIDGTHVSLVVVSTYTSNIWIFTGVSIDIGTVKKLFSGFLSKGIDIEFEVIWIIEIKNVISWIFDINFFF